MPAISQFGVAEEVTFGTVVTPSRFWPFRSESISSEIERVDSEALMASRVLKSSQWQPGTRSIEGDVEIELANKGMGLLFKHMFGSIATAQPDAGGSPTVYKHTASPGTLAGKSLTSQVGREFRNGTVQPFTYHGTKIASWSLECGINELAVLTLSLLGEEEDTATALATASYPTGLKLMSFVQGSVTIAGSSVSVRSATLEGDNNLDADQFKFGSQLRNEPVERGLRTYTGELDCDFNDLTLYNRFTSGAEAALVLLFQGETINATYKYETKFTLNIRTDGTTPTVGGQEEIRQPVSFTALNTGASDDTAIKVEYQTTDATP